MDEQAWQRPHKSMPCDCSLLRMHILLYIMCQPQIKAAVVTN
jgi:hypothetical protein